MSDFVTTAKYFVYGGLASMTAEFGTFPIDTTKTRLQIQGQVTDEACKDIKYRGMLHALYRITREERIRALYNGIAPALLRQASYGTIKIGLYNSFKQHLAIYAKGETLFNNILCGASSGALAAAIANPTDVLKVRMQAATSEMYATRESMLCAFNKIYKTEGWNGLYRGVSPTAQRAAVVAGVLLPFYDFFKSKLLSSDIFVDNAVTHLLSGFLAGVLGIIAANPIDVVKSRMMNQRKLKNIHQSHIYTSSLDCFIKTIRTEGPFALYRGIIPSYLRLGPWNIIFFITYEQLKILF